MDETQARKLGGQVRRARNINDWTQAELAAEAGVAPGTINRIENGKEVRPGNLRAILDALGIPPEASAPHAVDDGVKLALDIVEKWLEAIPEPRRNHAIQELTRFTVLGDWQDS